MVYGHALLLLVVAACGVLADRQPLPTIPPQPVIAGAGAAAAGGEHWVLKPTIFPAARYDAKHDADLLHDAFTGPLSNESVIIRVLTSRNTQQRLVIADEFKKYHGKELREELKSELTGNMEEISKALVTPLPEFYAKQLKFAMEGLGTNEGEIAEILSTVDNAMIRQIVQAYTIRYGKRLQAEIESETSGVLERLLVLMIQANRDESHQVNLQVVRSDAAALHNNGNPRWNSEGADKLQQVLALRSYPHLRKVFAEYERLARKSFKDTVEEEFSSGTEEGIVALVKAVQDPHRYFAKTLHEAMEGLGTRDHTLIRIFVTRAELDLGNIKEEYERKYQKTLVAAIVDETSGSYSNMLVRMLG